MALVGRVNAVIPHRNCSPGGGATTLPVISVPSQNAVKFPRPNSLRSNSDTTSAMLKNSRIETVTSAARVRLKSTFKKSSLNGLNGQLKQGGHVVVDVVNVGLNSWPPVVVVVSMTCGWTLA